MKYKNLTVLAAFSREQEGKFYVQHKIREQSEYLSKLIIEEKAHIYVSGKAKNMPTSVEKAFAEIITKHYPTLDGKTHV